MTGNDHGCLVHFVNNAKDAVLFAMDPKKFQVNDKITASCQTNVSQALFQCYKQIK